MLFGGEYQLLDFIINDKEFRIPFVGSGLPVDDISNGSASQVDIMGMAINLVLLYQASTHYNIARLDEVSGSLDTYNRSQFIGVLERMADVLKFDQIFCISHDSEIDNANVDMIKLKSLEAYDTTNNSSANIIYNYQEIIRNS
jgi:DNA repair exonuclease SbcCD ATPase subunit